MWMPQLRSSDRNINHEEFNRVVAVVFRSDPVTMDACGSGAYKASWVSAHTFLKIAT